MKGINKKLKVKEKYEKYSPSNFPLFTNFIEINSMPAPQGHIFVCTKRSESECLQRRIFATNKFMKIRFLELKRAIFYFYLILIQTKFWVLSLLKLMVVKT